ncbi:MAG TPA: CsbD family protein [Azospira sp.]|nr:CsbD family protein [Azospira sp.]
MNADRLSGRLQQFVGRLQQHWGKLTADPSLEEAGWDAQVSGLARERRALCNARAERQLDEFIERHRHWQGR